MGKTKKWYFTCEIKKLPKSYNNLLLPQDESRIYIKNKDGTYYVVHVVLYPINHNKNKNEKLCHWYMRMLESYHKDVYKILTYNISKIQFKEKNNDFLYSLYDIPSYIWCVVTGMLLAEI